MSLFSKFKRCFRLAKKTETISNDTLCFVQKEQNNGDKVVIRFVFDKTNRNINLLRALAKASPLRPKT